MKKLFNITIIKKIMNFLGPEVVKLLVLGFLTGLCFFLAELCFAYSIRIFLSQLIGSTEDIHLPTWIPHFTFNSLLIFILLVGFVRGLLQWGQVYLRGSAAEQLKYLQRARLLHWAFHSESVSSSDVTAYFNERTTSAGIFMTSLQSGAISLTSAFFLGMSLIYISPVLTSIATAAMCVLYWPMKRADEGLRKAGEGLNDEWAKTNSRLLMSIRNLLLMQIYGTQKREEALAQKSLRTYLYHYLKYFKASGLKFALPQILGVGLICLLTMLAFSRHLVASGILITYFYLFVRFLQNLSEGVRVTADLNVYWAQLASLAGWWARHSFDGVSENKIETAPASIQAFPKPVGWNIDNISFSYASSLQPIFKNFSLKIEPGDFTVILGPSGVGKTTLLNLLIGGSIPTNGSITVFERGELPRSLDAVRPQLLRSVGYVGAESFLLEGTILENLTYGLENIPKEEEILKALNQAECQFVFQIPAGLQYRLTEQGQGLSAGQKQRLSLARALLRRPQVLILDEATANLDSETEDKLMETLSKLKDLMTIVAVTHRQAMLKVADQQVCLKERVDGE